MLVVVLDPFCGKVFPLGGASGMRSMMALRCLLFGSGGFEGEKSKTARLEGVVVVPHAFTKANCLIEVFSFGRVGIVVLVVGTLVVFLTK